MRLPSAAQAPPKWKPKTKVIDYWENKSENRGGGNTSAQNGNNDALHQHQSAQVPQSQYQISEQQQQQQQEHQQQGYAQQMDQGQQQWGTEFQHEPDSQESRQPAGDGNGGQGMNAHQRNQRSQPPQPSQQQHEPIYEDQFISPTTQTTQQQSRMDSSYATLPSQTKSTSQSYRSPQTTQMFVKQPQGRNERVQQHVGSHPSSSASESTHAAFQTTSNRTSPYTTGNLYPPQASESAQSAQSSKLSQSRHKPRAMEQVAMTAETDSSNAQGLQQTSNHSNGVSNGTNDNAANNLGGFLLSNHDIMKRIVKFDEAPQSAQDSLFVDMQRSTSTTSTTELQRAVQNYRTSYARRIEESDASDVPAAESTEEKYRLPPLREMVKKQPPAPQPTQTAKQRENPLLRGHDHIDDHLGDHSGDDEHEPVYEYKSVQGEIYDQEQTRMVGQQESHVYDQQQSQMYDQKQSQANGQGQTKMHAPARNEPEQPQFDQEHFDQPQFDQAYFHQDHFNQAQFNQTQNRPQRQGYTSNQQPMMDAYDDEDDDDDDSDEVHVDTHVEEHGAAHHGGTQMLSMQERLQQHAQSTDSPHPGMSMTKHQHVQHGATSTDYYEDMTDDDTAAFLEANYDDNHDQYDDQLELPQSDDFDGAYEFDQYNSDSVYADEAQRTDMDHVNVKADMHAPAERDTIDHHYHPDQVTRNTVEENLHSMAMRVQQFDGAPAPRQVRPQQPPRSRPVQPQQKQQHQQYHQAAGQTIPFKEARSAPNLRPPRQQQPQQALPQPSKQRRPLQQPPHQHQYQQQRQRQQPLQQQQKQPKLYPPMHYQQYFAPDKLPSRAVSLAAKLAMSIPAKSLADEALMSIASENQLPQVQNQPVSSPRKKPPARALRSSPQLAVPDHLLSGSPRPAYPVQQTHKAHQSQPASAQLQPTNATNAFAETAQTAAALTQACRLPPILQLVNTNLLQHAACTNNQTINPTMSDEQNDTTGTFGKLWSFLDINDDLNDYEDDESWDSTGKETKRSKRRQERQARQLPTRTSSDRRSHDSYREAAKDLLFLNAEKRTNRLSDPIRRSQPLPNEWPRSHEAGRTDAGDRGGAGAKSPRTPRGQNSGRKRHSSESNQRGDFQDRQRDRQRPRERNSQIRKQSERGQLRDHQRNGRNNEQNQRIRFADGTAFEDRNGATDSENSDERDHRNASDDAQFNNGNKQRDRQHAGNALSDGEESNTYFGMDVTRVERKTKTRSKTKKMKTSRLFTLKPAGRNPNNAQGRSKSHKVRMGTLQNGNARPTNNAQDIRAVANLTETTATITATSGSSSATNDNLSDILGERPRNKARDGSKADQLEVVNAPRSNLRPRPPRPVGKVEPVNKNSATTTNNIKNIKNNKNNNGNNLSNKNDDAFNSAQPIAVMNPPHRHQVREIRLISGADSKISNLSDDNDDEKLFRPKPRSFMNKLGGKRFKSPGRVQLNSNQHQPKGKPKSMHQQQIEQRQRQKMFYRQQQKQQKQKQLEQQQRQSQPQHQHQLQPPNQQQQMQGAPRKGIPKQLPGINQGRPLTAKPNGENRVQPAKGAKNTTRPEAKKASNPRRSLGKPGGKRARVGCNNCELSDDESVSSRGDNGRRQAKASAGRDKPTTNRARSSSGPNNTQLQSRQRQTKKATAVIAQQYVAYSQFGNSAESIIKFCEHASIPVPKTKKGELLIRIIVSTVSAADTVIRRGRWNVVALNPFIIPGTTFVGEICGDEQKAKKVNPLVFNNMKPGDRVMALVTRGGNARFACVHKDRLVKIPLSVNPALASCLAETYLGAFQAAHIGQRSSTRYKKSALTGKSILILGGYCPLTHAIIEVALAARADAVYCIAAKGRESELISDVGGIPIGHTAQEWLPHISRQISILIAARHGPDVEEVKTDHLKTLNEDGQVVLLDPPGVVEKQKNMPNLSKLFCASSKQKLLSRLHAFNVFDSFDNDPKQARRDMGHLVELLGDKRLQPPVLDVVSLPQVAKAQSILESNRVTGHFLCDPWE